MSPDIEADFQRELALLEAESLGWLPLEPGVTCTSAMPTPPRCWWLGCRRLGRLCCWWGDDHKPR